jgi:hypothetical protein
MIRPACFNSEGAFEDYMERLAATGPKGATYCWDCTPKFQREMHEENRCGHPSVKFVMVRSPSTQDESLQGVRE